MSALTYIAITTGADSVEKDSVQRVLMYIRQPGVVGNLAPATLELEVRDPQGALAVYTLAGAQIVANSDGGYEYDVPALLAGSYSVTAASTGPQAENGTAFQAVEGRLV